MTAGASREGLRRAFHFIVGLLVALTACCIGLSPRTVSLLFAALLAAIALLELARRYAPPVQGALVRLAMGTVRPEEQRGITGGTVLALGFALAWWLFPPDVATRAILVAATADPAASAIGTLAGPRGRKTVAGSLAALAVSMLVLAVSGATLRVTAIGAVAAMFAERFPGRAMDNLAVPLATAAVLWAGG